MTTVTTPKISRPAFLAKVPACEPSRVRVAVLMGGESSEREVSLLSGREVAKGLRRAGFMVDEIDLRPSDVDALKNRTFDVAFIALHGTFGEDGTLQERLDALGIAYTGSGPAASRIAMDKVASKERFVRAGVATPAWALVPSGDAAAARAVFEKLGPALVVKPRDEGSSVAVTLAENWAEYQQGLAEVFKIRDSALAEQWIRGRELTVGVLHDQGLPIIEIITKRKFYDYQAKYIDNDTQYVANPDLSVEVAAMLRKSAVAAHQSLGCRDISRIDYLLGSDGVGYALEANTIPGFTTHSLLPKAAGAAGLAFDDLCRYIVELSLARKSRAAR